MLRIHATTVVAFVCCIVIAHAEKNSSEELSEHAESAVKKKAEIGSVDPTNNRFISFVKDKFTSLMKITNPDLDVEGDSENERAFDLSFNGNKTTQNVSFITTVPVNPVNGYVRGQLFLMRHRMSQKSDSDSMLDETDPISSTSYLIQLEGDVGPTVFDFVTPRGQFEIEKDPTIETDPHLHLSAYLEIGPPKSWIKGGVGGWGEFNRLFEDADTTQMNDAANQVHDRRSRYGVRAHLDFAYNRERIDFSMEVEYLPELGADKHEYSIRMSPELKIDIHEDWLSFHLIGEIDYYSDREYVTIEPLLDMFKPWDTSLTHLWRIEY